MQRCPLVAASVLVVGIPLAAQESLWSGTMTAGETETSLNGAVVGYSRYPMLPAVGEISDPEFDFDGTTHRVYALLQAERHRTAGEWSVAVAFSPPLDHRDLESMTLTLEGKALHVSDALAVSDVTSLDPSWSEVLWTDPGFRWTDGRRVAAELTMTRPVPALPLASAGLLASLLVLGAYRRVASRA